MADPDEWERSMFDRGSWRSLRVDSYALEEYQKDHYTAAVTCGSWRLQIMPVQALRDQALLGFAFEVFIEGPLPIDPERGPKLMESVVVRDFVSLLQLFAFLRTAEIGQAPDDE